MATTKGLIPKVDIAAPNYEDVEQEYDDFSEVHILRMALPWSDNRTEAMHISLDFIFRIDIYNCYTFLIISLCLFIIT